MSVIPLTVNISFTAPMSSTMNALEKYVRSVVERSQEVFGLKRDPRLSHKQLTESIDRAERYRRPRRISTYIEVDSFNG